MKRIRIPQRCCSAQSLVARSRPTPTSPASRLCRQARCSHQLSYTQSSPFSSIPPYAAQSSTFPPSTTPATSSSSSIPLEDLPSPHVSSSLTSAKLAALHARLSLPQRFPLQTLARTLVDRTADPDPHFNNAQLAVLGEDLMGYYMSEHLICQFPRLPMDVLFAAQEAYVGPKALMTVSREWGVEEAAEPGGEVDAGLVQFRYATPGMMEALSASESGSAEMETEVRNESEGRANVVLAKSEGWRRGMSSRIVYDDQFGLEPSSSSSSTSETRVPLSTPQDAHANFVRALVGALQLHTGRATTKKFFQNHFLSRSLDLSKLFDFRYPTRDLSRLCLREGFERPVARLVSETGRLSSHPVFVVGVYSGRDKLGEAVGSSLEEAKNRAAAAALKGWYLYSPGADVVTVPSEAEDGVREWRTNMIDPGEIVT